MFLQNLEEKNKDFEKQKKKLEEEVEGQKKEHEDLLVYMNDQDNRLSIYKEKLKKHGEVVCTNVVTSEIDNPFT